LTDPRIRAKNSVRMFESIRQFLVRRKEREDPSAGSADPDPWIRVRKSEWDAKLRRIEELEAEVAMLRDRLSDLEEKVRTSSRNSSKPPSSDSPAVPKKDRHEGGKSGRRRGAQPGHEGSSRSLLPVDPVDHVVECMPEERCGCGGLVRIDRKPKERRQVFEIPEPKPVVTEFRIFEGLCPDCGKHHVGALPPGVPTGVLGPRAMSAVAVLAGVSHQRRRHIEDLFQTLFGVDICLGTVSNTEARVSEALRGPVEDAREYVRGQPVVHMDETGHRMAGKRAWLWVAATSLVSVFLVRFSRGAEVAKEVLGDAFRGLLVSDRWSGYSWVAARMRQLCWAHLIRDFTKIAERHGASERIGKGLVALAGEMFHPWHRLRDGILDRIEFQAAMVPIRDQVEALLREGTTCGQAKTQRTCANVIKLRWALWTFVDMEGVEPTNNFAERVIRPFVLWRKGSFGTQAERGNAFVERMMTVRTSCRLQRRNVLEFVTQAVEASLRNTAAPSLLPISPATILALAA